MKIPKKTFVFAMALSLVACESTKKEEMKKEANDQQYTINTSWMDTTTAASDDFYQFADGTWLAHNEVPASESVWGSFNVLDKENKKKLTIILDESLETKNEEGSNRQIIGDYYQAMKDMAVRNEQSDKNIQDIKEEINSIESRSQLADAIYKMNEKGINAFYNAYIEQNLKAIDENVLYLSQGGLGLPNRNYYYDEEKEGVREAYKEFMEEAIQLFNYDNAKEISSDAFEVEKKLAETMMKPEELRVPENTYHPTAVKDAKKFADFVNIDNYLARYDNQAVDSIILEQPEHFAAVEKYVASEDFSKLHNYIIWKYVNHYASYLNQELLDANFNFYGKALSGKSEMKPVNERAIDEMTGKAVKTALAKEFVEHYFPEEAKAKINVLVDNLFKVYEDRIQKLDWMGEDTKQEALKKLHSITRKLGYPDKWESLDGLTIVGDDYKANIDACALFSFNKNMRKLGQPVDKDEWGMPAHLVNAYYHPLLNEIAFPAGIMQPPFFDINAEDALNYAGIGMVIGHELTHGFDDMGSKFAADGSFTNWWSADDRANFEERTQKLGATFAQFCPFEGHCVNPDVTMGENIADLGGIRMAYYAYTLTDQFKEGTVRDGYTPAQRFFIAYGQLWKINYTDAELKRRIATDPHSPGKYRVNGPLMNTPEFFEAFNLKEGDKMRKSEKEIAEIW